MTGIEAIAGGLIPTALGWGACRYAARAVPRLNWALPIDLAGPLALFVLLFAASARPWFAGAVSLAIFVGFAFADATKRAILHEPVVFSDISELIEIFRHPRFYLPYAGTGLVTGAVAAIGVALLALLIIEPGQWRWSPWPGLGALAVTVLGTVAAFHQPCLGQLARFAHWLGPQAEPFADAARFGPLAVLPVYGAIARAERRARRPPVATPAIRPARANAPPIVLLQAESFFDARRLHSAVPRDLLPQFDRARARGIQSGRFGVSGWGAYTIRAEFAALSGLSDDALGFDRWNPYHAFARAELPSLARHLRDEGYRTLCLHPFDKRYYGRDLIFPRIGFDEFWGEEQFAGAGRVGPYVSDEALAARAAEILREEGRGLFLFVISMENHGPWPAGDPRRALPDPAPSLPDLPGGAELRCFLHGLRHGDAMLGAIGDAAAAQGGLIAAYGDHVPSLPATYDALNFTDSATDYAIWGGAGGGAGARIDLAAHDLPVAILAARGRR
ncbi:MAG TPA: LTA synthase family protein [Stellaceae bacterium]